MSKTWKIIVFIVGGILFLLLAYVLVDRYLSVKGPHSSALEAIGPGVVFFAQSDDIRAALYKLTNESDYWPVLLDDSLLARFQSRFLYLDSLISSRSGLNALIELQTFTLALYPAPDGGYDFTYLLELPPGHSEYGFEEFIRAVNGEQSVLLRKEFDRAEIVTVNLAGPEALFFYTVHKGVFAGSFEESLVRSTIAQLNSRQSILRDPAFQRIHPTAGKNVEANFYIHIPNFMEWGGRALAGEHQPVAEGLKGFGTWTEIDLLLNNDNLLFNGYTIAGDTGHRFLDRFMYTPQPVRVTEILPAQVSWMVHLGVADFGAFLAGGRSNAALNSLFAGYEQDFGIDLGSEFVDWVGHEVAVAGIRHEAGGEGHLVLVHSEDVVRAVLSLGTMEAKVNQKNRTTPYLLEHTDYKIRKLGLNRLFSDLLGNPFPVMENTFYVTLKDYIIFSESPGDLVMLIDQFYNRKTLAEDVNYKAFSDNISDHSNIYVFARLDDPGSWLWDLAGNAGSRRLIGDLRHFEGFALQFSYINRMFYTNMFLSYNPESTEDRGTGWLAELDDAIVDRPTLVRNHRTGMTNVLAFDRSNRMYLLDQNGRRQWDLAMEEPPLGRVYLVDYYGNGKNQYLFNSENYIFLVDLNGNHVADFPRKLPASSTGPLSLFDYDNDGNVRIVLALDDNKVHNYNLRFEPVEGWEKIQAAAAVRQPVQHLRNGGKDYLIVTDANGQVKITDRRGRERISLAVPLNKAVHSRFHINRTNSKGLFITTDQEGKLVYLTEEGKVSRTGFGSFGPEHFFFYEDLDGDDHHDFIFLDRNRMVVFDRFKKVILDQDFAEVITRRPVIFSWAGRKYIAVVLDALGEIQLYDHRGRRFGDLRIEGTVPCAAGTLEQGKLNLITGKDSFVSSYQLR